MMNEQELPSRIVTEDGFFRDVELIEFRISAASLRHEIGNCYIYDFKTVAFKLFARLLVNTDYSFYENGKRLPFYQSLHASIREEGSGRYSIWYDVIYFSSSDNSDPRYNGNTYSLFVPGFVSFVENMPPAGIQKFKL